MQHGRMRLAAALVALIALFPVAACGVGSAKPTAFTPPPSPAAVEEARQYAADHATDPVKYHTKDGHKAKDWVRGVVLQDGIGTSPAEGVKWKASVIWPDGHKDLIAATGGNDADAVNLAVNPGDYIAYYRPWGGQLTLDTLIVIQSDAVPSVHAAPAAASVAPSGNPSPTKPHPSGSARTP